MKRIVLFVLSIILSGCGGFGQPRIEILDIEILEAKVSGISSGDLNFRCICDVSEIQTTTPVFLTIRNKGGQADRLMKAETDRAAKIELRDGSKTDNLMSGTELLDTVEIKAFETLPFRDGKYMMILTGVIDDIRPGDTVKITLFFEKSGEIEIEAVAIAR